MPRVGVPEMQEEIRLSPVAQNRAQRSILIQLYSLRSGMHDVDSGWKSPLRSVLTLQLPAFVRRFCPPDSFPQSPVVLAFRYSKQETSPISTGSQDNTISLSRLRIGNETFIFFQEVKSQVQVTPLLHVAVHPFFLLLIRPLLPSLSKQFSTQLLPSDSTFSLGNPVKNINPVFYSPKFMFQ